MAEKRGITMSNMESRIVTQRKRLCRIIKRCNEIQKELKMLETKAIKLYRK